MSISSALARLARLQHSGHLTDYKISCGEQTWPVHRVVIFLHSEVLAKACTGSFKEAGEGQIDLSSENPTCIEALIFYFYHFTYDQSTPVDPSQVLDFHVQMCVLADKYAIEPLRQLAIRKFRLACNDTNTSVEMISEAAERAYEAQGPTKEIRERIVRFAIQRNLFASIAKDGPSAFELVMRRTGELATDIAMAQLAACKTDTSKLYACTHCGEDKSFGDVLPEKLANVFFSCDWCGGFSTGLKWKSNVSS